MLNSQLQHHQLHQSTPSQQQLHQFHAPLDAAAAATTTNGLFLFDDLTTALRDHNDQTASISSANTSPMTMSDTASLMYSAMVSPSTIHQLAQQLGTSPTTNMQQPQQNCCFGEFSLSLKKNTHRKKFHQKKIACKLRLLPSTIQTKHVSQLHPYINHINRYYKKKTYVSIKITSLDNLHTYKYISVNKSANHHTTHIVIITLLSTKI